MKYIFNFRLLFVAALLVFVSCDSSDDDTSFLDNRENVAYFAPVNTGTLLVEEDASRSYDVIVGVSDSKSFARTYTIMTDPTSEAVEGVDYSMASNTFVIEANSVVGSFKLLSGDYASSTLNGKTVKFVLVEIEDNTPILENRSVFTLTVVRYCPIPDEYMAGEYAISDVDATTGPANGTENFASGTVTIMTDPEDPTARVFMSPSLPAFNSEVETVVLNLSCGNLKFAGVDPGIFCTEDVPYIFIDNLEAADMYDLADDSFFLINYTEDPNGSCGGPFSSSFSLTKL
ncbi:hypothetical protein [Psychroserpens ponticola]|uniref:Calx-beta domain-containing protein n=1 Tax=Psychroserpens ponticola TaxID=2932268 RepID=A0ABY7RV89_9FLAO|nr:hypothetical protein [Psychroserpens ponticola]WCO01030.1 hypothetical protein MUN68_013270 [Psychroserpens ponticola]